MEDVTFSGATNREATLVCLLELNVWGKLSSSSRNRIVKLKEWAINEEICG